MFSKLAIGAALVCSACSASAGLKVHEYEKLKAAGDTGAVEIYLSGALSGLISISYFMKLNGNEFVGICLPKEERLMKPTLEPLDEGIRFLRSRAGEKTDDLEIISAFVAGLPKVYPCKKNSL